MYRFLIMLALVLATAVGQSWAIGSLFVRPLRTDQEFQDIHIKSYNVNVDIQDHVAITHVDQIFTNTLNTTVEATLIFPLPPGAVITEMYYHFNGQRYKASVRERKEAQSAYASKIRKFLDPALLQEIGENIFKLNIAPVFGATDVRVEITYTEVLPFSLGSSTYTHLLRSTGVSPRPLEQMSMRIDLKGSSEFQTVESPTHPFGASHQIDTLSEDHYRITLGDENYVSTRNYDLRIRNRRAGVEMGTLTYVPVPSDSFGVEPFFLTWVIPPDSGASALPRSVTFVADVSSSMEGARMQQLRQALHAFLSQLNPEDRFNIITFSTGTAAFQPDLVPATAENIQRARRFADNCVAMGLTNISDALKHGLSMPYAPETVALMIFLTDGQPSWGIRNQAEILDSVQVWNTKQVRIYPVTIGQESSVALMRNIAKLTGGFLTEVMDDDVIAVRVNDHLRRISMPNLTDLTLDYGGLSTLDVVPRVLPNVPVGGRVIQNGRYREGGLYPVTLAGKMQDAPFSLTQDVLFGNPATNNRAVARLWAQAKIEDLLREIDRVGEQDELVDAVIELSLRFEILTKYTALYADPDEGNVTSVPGEDRPIESVRIVVAPHPATVESSVTIHLPSGTVGQRVLVELRSLTGQIIAVLHDGPAASKVLEIQHWYDGWFTLAPGTYLLTVTTDTDSFSQPLLWMGGVR